MNYTTKYNKVLIVFIKNPYIVFTSNGQLNSTVNTEKSFI